MFGLFGTEKNPKGPNVKRLQQLNFDLVDSRLSFSLPYSNDTFLERNHEVKQSFNIFDHSLYTHSELEELYSHKLLLQRHYEYSRFNHRGYGGVNFALKISRHNQVNNLFNTVQLKEIVSIYSTKEIEHWNINADKEWKLRISDDFSYVTIGNEKMLSFGRSQTYDNVPMMFYIIAVAPQHYITFSFNYISVRNTEEVWYQMAKAIEHQILSSVKLELNDELQAEKDNANKG